MFIFVHILDFSPYDRFLEMELLESQHCTPNSGFVLATLKGEYWLSFAPWDSSEPLPSLGSQCL
jgi:hypothetical protein